MKILPFLILASLFNFISIPSFACKAGDTSKILLLIRAADGEENKVVADVSTTDASITLLRSGYIVKDASSSVITLESSDRVIYSFERKNAAQRAGLCFASIYAN